MNSFNEQYEMLARAAQREPSFSMPALAEGRYRVDFHDREMPAATRKNNPFVTAWLWVLGLALGTTLLCTTVLVAHGLLTL